jgi:hypothetical protein
LNPYRIPSLKKLKKNEMEIFRFLIPLDPSTALSATPSIARHAVQAVSLAAARDISACAATTGTLNPLMDGFRSLLIFTPQMKRAS